MLTSLHMEITKVCLISGISCFFFCFISFWLPRPPSQPPDWFIHYHLERNLEGTHIRKLTVTSREKYNIEVCNITPRCCIYPSRHRSVPSKVAICLNAGSNCALQFSLDLRTHYILRPSHAFFYSWVDTLRGDHSFTLTALEWQELFWRARQNWVHLGRIFQVPIYL